MSQYRLTLSIQGYVRMYESGLLKIPPHQRDPTKWDKKLRATLIGHIYMGGYIDPPKLYSTGEIHPINGQHVYEVDDGLQRLMTVIQYTLGKNTLDIGFGTIVDPDGKLFVDLDDEKKRKFLDYNLDAVVLTGYTNTERIQFFSNYQGGCRLTTGDRLHAIRMISDIVDFTITYCLTPNEELGDISKLLGNTLHEKMNLVWGKTMNNTDTSKNNLMYCCAFTYACAQQNTALMDTKYETLSRNATMNITSKEKKIILATMNTALDTILIMRDRWADTKKRVPFSLMAYIVHYLIKVNKASTSNNSKFIDWVLFAVLSQNMDIAMDIINKNASKARFWEVVRWNKGLDNVRQYIDSKTNPRTWFVENK